MTKGTGVAQDDRKALKWLRKAAEQGQASAQIYLGWMYKEGRGVAQDDRKAVEWLRKAAEQGHADCSNLPWGGCMRKAKVCQKTLQKPLNGLEKQLIKDMQTAQFNLGCNVSRRAQV